MGARLSAVKRRKACPASDAKQHSSRSASDDAIDALFYQSLIRCLTSTTDFEVANGVDDPLRLSQLGQVTAMVLQEMKNDIVLKLGPSRHDQQVFLDVCEQAHGHLFASTVPTTDHSILNKLLTKPPAVAQEQTKIPQIIPATDTTKKKNLLSGMFEAGQRCLARKRSPQKMRGGDTSKVCSTTTSSHK